jgi:ribosomal protein S18 acetylase RimI-like enzyme
LEKCGYRKACALILYPHKLKTNIKTVLLDIKFINRVVGFGSIIKMLKWSAMIKKVMPTEKLMYLWFIGVDPQHQYKGIGTQFLTQILKWSENKKLPVYLETSTIENLPWYKKFNFEIYHEQDMGYPLFFLKRENK